VGRVVQLGLVGGGRWGRVYAKTLERLDSVHLAAFSSRNPENWSIAPKNCLTTSNWWDLTEMAAPNGILDGLILAVPPEAQVEIAAAAMEAGLPVLLEKPVALDTSNAMRLLNLAESRNSFVMVDHTQLFNVAFHRLKDRLAKLGGAAVVSQIKARAGNWGPFRSNIPVYWDWGAHEIAMSLDIMGRLPSSIAAKVLERRDEEGGLGERVKIQLQFGTVAVRIQLNNMSPEKFRLFEVQAGDAALRYDGVGVHNFASKPAPGAQWEWTEIPGALPLDNVIGEFAIGVLAGVSDHQGLRLGADVVAVLERCQAALKSGQTVSI
jgi:predicted dehydrogenase